MIQSQQVLEWQAQAKAETLIRQLQTKFTSLPEGLQSEILATRNHSLLDAWPISILEANSLDEFRESRYSGRP
jgi:hypothetical protein